MALFQLSGTRNKPYKKSEGKYYHFLSLETFVLTHALPRVASIVPFVVPARELEEEDATLDPVHSTWQNSWLPPSVHTHLVADVPCPP